MFVPYFEKRRWGYGLAWRCFERDGCIYYPMPFNWVAAAARGVYYFFARQHLETHIEKLEHALYDTHQEVLAKRHQHLIDDYELKTDRWAKEINETAHHIVNAWIEEGYIVKTDKWDHPNNKQEENNAQ